jgi:nitrogen fixation protein FixH
VGIFAVQSCMLAATMVLASRTPANAEPGYYDKAIAWNDHAAAAARPRREGWAWSVATHGRLVTLTLADASERPMRGAGVSATAFHRAAALDRHALSFVETAPGVYRATLPEHRAGVWEFRFAVEGVGDGASVPAAIVETAEVR